MAQDGSLIIDWKGEEKDRVGELMCTLEVDQDSMTEFEAALAKAVDAIDPAAIAGIRELSSAISEIVSAGIHVSMDVYTALAPIYEQASNAMEQFAQQLRIKFEPVIDMIAQYRERHLDIYETYYDCEIAYRKYTVILNWQRPRGRKLGWRRLNRQQRRDAISWYLSEYGPFAVYGLKNR